MEKNRNQPASKQAKVHADILKKAFARPEFREVMEIYDNWQKVDLCMEPYRQATRRYQEINRDSSKIY